MHGLSGKMVLFTAIILVTWVNVKNKLLLLGNCNTNLILHSSCFTNVCNGRSSYAHKLAYLPPGMTKYLHKTCQMLLQRLIGAFNTYFTLFIPYLAHDNGSMNCNHAHIERKSLLCHHLFLRCSSYWRLFAHDNSIVERCITFLYEHL